MSLMGWKVVAVPHSLFFFFIEMCSLNRNLMRFLLMGFEFKTWDSFFFPLSPSPFLNGNVYSMYVLTLYFWSTFLVFWFIGSHVNRNFSQGWTRNCVSPITIWKTFNKIWALELTLKRVKTLGDVGIEWIYLTLGKDRKLRGCNVHCYVSNSVLKRVFRILTGKT